MSILSRRNSVFSPHYCTFRHSHLQWILASAILGLLIWGNSTAATSGGVWVEGIKGSATNAARAPMAMTYRHYINPWYLSQARHEQPSPRSKFSDSLLLQGSRLIRLVSRKKKSFGALARLYPTLWSRPTTTTTPVPRKEVRKEAHYAHFIHDDAFNYMFPLGLSAVGRRPKGRRLRWG